MCRSAAPHPLVRADYIKQYAARRECIRRVGASPPPPPPRPPARLNCARSCFISGLSLIRQTFGGATLGWIDRACHCFTGSHSTMELYRLPCESLVNVAALQKNPTAWICHSSPHTHVPSLISQCVHGGDTKVNVVWSLCINVTVSDQGER